MQRADKIGLIIASVLVVLLAAGGALLLVKRNETLANERPQDASVKLTQLDDTSTLPATPATTTPAKQETKPVVPSKPKGYDFGFVTKVGGSGKSMYVKWDQAELLTGKDADVYAKKNGAVINTELYYIANDTHKNKTYDLSTKATVVVTNSNGTTSTIGAADFSKQWNAGGPIRKRPWFMFAEDGVITRMVQVVLPKSSTQ